MWLPQFFVYCFKKDPMCVCIFYPQGWPVQLTIVMLIAEIEPVGVCIICQELINKFHLHPSLKIMLQMSPFNVFSTTS